MVVSFWSYDRVDEFVELKAVFCIVGVKVELVYFLKFKNGISNKIHFIFHVDFSS